MPAIPGTMTSSSLRLPLTIAPNSARKISGRRKLKNAALGLRQNRWRSKRYWRQSSSSIRRELQVDVLEARPRHGDALEALVAGERRARQLVQQRRRIVGLVHDRLAVAHVRDAVARAPADAELGGRSLGEDAAADDDRHAVRELLRLIEVVRREQHRLAEVAQRADRLPRGAPRC